MFDPTRDPVIREQTRALEAALGGKPAPTQPASRTRADDTPRDGAENGGSVNVGAVGSLRAEGIQPYRPFPHEALPGGVQEYVAAVAKATSTDPAYAAVAVLVTAAGCIGNRVAVEVRHGWTEPAVLWGACIGRSGTVKSAVLKLVTKPVVAAYKIKRAAFLEATTDYAIAQQQHAVDLAAWKQSQKSGPRRDPPLPPDPPREERVLVSDITVEKLGCLLSQNPLGLLVVRDELGGWVGAFDRYAGGGRGSDRPAWLSMHDASPLTVDRKSQDGSLFVERAAVSVLGSLQPGTLARVFGCEEREAGLLARVLLTCPPTRPARWTDDGLPDHLAERWQNIVNGLLALTPTEDVTGDPRPRTLTISAEAKPAWVRWHDTHMAELADLDDDDLGAGFSKLKGGCIRFALILTCIRLVESGGSAACIDADCMARAIRITEWFKGEARRVYGLLAGDREDHAARRLVDLIERKGGVVTARDLMRCSRSYPTADDAEAALSELVNAGLGEWENPPPDRCGGKPSRRFRLVDNTHAQKPVDTVDVDNTPSGGVENRGIVNVNAVNTPKAAGSVNAGNDASDTGWKDFA
ncbi:MAG: DUF3987 domain-containing protein [Phycisphaerae bacterium]|nr:DUF3987 domain-containing protein [Phycisphaerae bacterium]